METIKDDTFEKLYNAVFKKYYDAVRLGVTNDNNNELIKKFVDSNISKTFSNSIAKFGGMKNDNFNKVFIKFIRSVEEFKKFCETPSDHYYAEFINYILLEHDSDIATKVANDSVRNVSSYARAGDRFLKELNNTISIVLATNNYANLKRSLDNFSFMIDFTKIDFFGDYQHIKMLFEADVAFDMNIQGIICDVLNNNKHDCFDLVFENYKKYEPVNLPDIFESIIPGANPTTIAYLETRFPNIFNAPQYISSLNLHEIMFKNYNNCGNRDLILYLVTKLYPERNIDLSSKFYRLMKKIGFNDDLIKESFKGMFVNAGIKLKAHPFDSFKFDNVDLMWALSFFRKNHSADTIKKILNEVKIIDLDSGEIYEFLSCYFKENLEDVKDGILKIVHNSIKKCHMSKIFEMACEHNNVNVAQFIIKYNKKNNFGIVMSYSSGKNEVISEVIYEYSYFDEKSETIKNVNKFLNLFFIN